MSVLDLLLAYLAPYECLSCSSEGDLICTACRRSLPQLPPRCYRCHTPSPAGATCPVCLKLSSIQRLQVAAVYDGAIKDLIWRLKSSGAKAATKLMANIMTEKMCLSNVLLVPVPTSPDRVRQRGYDQAELLARELSKQLNLPLAKLLIRHNKAHQVGANKLLRQVQLKNAFRASRRYIVQGQNILMIDDVVTTGSTLESAALALKAAGAANIEAAVFAQPLMRNE
jgi:competence protein ComFC